MIDLHIHSRYSEDGEFTPTELVNQCYEHGVRMMSITDHNCVKANTDAQDLANEKGISYIAGIEIDCVYKNANFHVLGYGIDFKSKDYELIEQNIITQSSRASLERLEYTQALGFQVTENDMWDISKNSYWETVWNGEMFAEVLLANPAYRDDPRLRPYRLGGSRSDNPYVNFYWDYYSQGKPCYAKMDYPMMEEVLETIHRNHGLAVLAHPGVNLKDREYMLNEVLELGMDGIEVFSSYHTPDQSEYYYKKACENKLLITCGSDFHGKAKPSIVIGDHRSFVSEDELYNRLQILFNK